MIIRPCHALLTVKVKFLKYTDSVFYYDLLLDGNDYEEDDTVVQIVTNELKEEIRTPFEVLEISVVDYKQLTSQTIYTA